jgi:hypothetical protein
VLPVEHAVPAGWTGQPAAGSQAPATWQASGAAQETALPPPHEPPVHVSPTVQALPSSQGVPSAAGVPLHVPATHVAFTMQGLPGSHAPLVRYSPPTGVHCPPWHVETTVHGLPLLQSVPSLAPAHCCAPQVLVPTQTPKPLHVAF